MRTREMLTTKDLATRWSMSEGTLRKWRMHSIGPKYIKVGKGSIRYRMEDIEDFEGQRESPVR